MYRKGVKTMSQLICIGSSEHIDFIRNKLELECKLLQAEGVVLTINEAALGGYTFWEIELGPHKNRTGLEEGTVFSFRYSLAKFLTEYIFANYEQQLVGNLVKNHYYYFNQDEQAFILDKSLEILREGNSLRRKNGVLQLVFEYLEEHKLLIIDGFVRFRLKGYLEDLAEVVDQAVDEFLMEKEYNDFIRLLKYFVDIQDPKVERVNVLIQPNGFFQLYDGQDNIIKSDYLESFIIELADNELNYEDLLISTLITLAPRQIILHLPDAAAIRGTVSTIESVFEERVVICSGCGKCVNTKKQQKKP
jgi:putative sporulation protein YtxC